MEAQRQLLLMQRALNALPVSFNIKDANGRYVFMNAQQLCHAGRTAADIVGKKVGVAGGAKWAEVVLERDRRVLEGGKAIGPLLDDFASLFGLDGCWLTYKAPVGTDDGLPDHVVTVSFDVTTYVENQNNLRRATFTDALTGLYNRRWLQESVADLLEREAHELPTWLFMIDADHFKLVNDSFGHSAGDWVLQEIGTRLRASIRPNDLAVRLGGEEFVIVVRDVEREEASAIAESVRVSFDGRPITQIEAAPSITVSIGCAILHGDRGLADTLERADFALYAAKRSGRNKVVFEDEVPTQRSGRGVPVIPDGEVSLQGIELHDHCQPEGFCTNPFVGRKPPH